MSGLPDRVAAAIRHHAIFTPGERVLVAVSGGPDSLALLAILRELIPAFSLHLTVAHFDHGWRPDSVDDARFVAAISEQWGYVCVNGHGSDDRPNHSARSELSARRARYAFLRESARATQSSGIALGHTQDDQVETLLLHLLRGSGSKGLSAMRPRAGDLARPLLDISRAEIESYLRARNLEPRRDPTNNDPRYTRNRLRQTVVPALLAFDPAARRLLARAAEIFAEEDRYLESETARLDPALVNDAAALSAIPIALQRRLLRRLNPALTFAEVEALRARPAQVTPSPVVAVNAHPCSCDPAGFRARDPIGHVDGDTIQPPLLIEPRRPGDRVRPLGFPTSKRVQDILVDARIPRHLRDALPIVRDQSGIVWIPGVTVADANRVTDRTRSQWHLEIVPLRGQHEADKSP
jgi:tRNA(Ile)-lysidine synthase